MQDDLTQAVKSRYGSVAQSGLSNEVAGVKAIAEAFGYSAGELSSIPSDANMGLSCGNPTAFASLRAGEVVVDLGCGGGLDVFLAAQKVGPRGKAIGIDMTPQMLERARASAAKGTGEGPIENVEFHLASIDRLPLADASADCIISNCVINLAPDKQAVFAEIYRILRPGGRLAISDIALKKPLPADLADDVVAFIGCIAGAISIETYERQLRQAGFQFVQVVDSHTDLNAYASLEGQSACCSPAMSTAACGPSALPIVEPNGDTAGDGESSFHAGLASLLARYDVNEYAASVKVYAVKQ